MMLLKYHPAELSLLMIIQYTKENLEATLMDLINDIKEITKHFNDSGLKLNYSKSKFMIIGRSDITEIPNEIHVKNNIKIERVRSIKFLGVIIDERFNFKEHHAKLVEELT